MLKSPKQALRDRTDVFKVILVYPTNNPKPQGFNI